MKTKPELKELTFDETGAILHLNKCAIYEAVLQMIKDEIDRLWESNSPKPVFNILEDLTEDIEEYLERYFWGDSCPEKIWDWSQELKHDHQEEAEEYLEQHIGTVRESWGL